MVKRMSISLIGLLAILCACPLARAQGYPRHEAASIAKTMHSATTSTPVPRQKVNVRAGTKISAVLVSRIDARTAKPGEEVAARVTKNVKQDGRTVIQKGDEIVGRVLSVLPGTYQTGSQVTVAFSRLVSGRISKRLNAVLAEVEALPGTRVRPDTNSFDASMFPAGLPGRRAGMSGESQDPTGLTGAAPGGGVTGSVGGTAPPVGGITRGSSARVSLSTPLEELRVTSNVQGENQTGAISVLSSRHGNLRLVAGTLVHFRVAAEDCKPRTHK